jgi:predicted HicB family RNase H-like nuclease
VMTVKGSHLNLRLSDDDHSWLQLSAKTNGVSKSEMVRRCIAMYREDEHSLEEMAAYYKQT